MSSKCKKNNINMNLDIVNKFNEIISLVDCNCGGKHQSAITIINEMLNNNWINELQSKEIDAIRVYQEYDINTYGYDQRLILMELYKQVYFMNKYPYNDLNDLLLEDNVYLRMKNVLYWIEFFYKSEIQSLIQQNVGNDRLNTIRDIINKKIPTTERINEIRMYVSEEEMFHYVKISQIKI